MLAGRVCGAWDGGIGMRGPFRSALAVLAALVGAAIGAPAAAQPPIVGSAWLVTEIEGTLASDAVRSTVEFPQPRRVAGTAGCNRYSGPIDLVGNRIHSIGPLAATRIACPAPVMAQERRVLQALGRAQRLGRNGPLLVIYGPGNEALLRLSPIQPDLQ